MILRFCELILPAHGVILLSFYRYGNLLLSERMITNNSTNKKNKENLKRESYEKVYAPTEMSRVYLPKACKKSFTMKLYDLPVIGT